MQEECLKQSKPSAVQATLGMIKNSLLYPIAHGKFEADITDSDRPWFLLQFIRFALKLAIDRRFVPYEPEASALLNAPQVVTYLGRTDGSEAKLERLLTIVQQVADGTVPSQENLLQLSRFLVTVTGTNRCEPESRLGCRLAKRVS